MTSCGTNLRSFRKAAVLAQAFFNCSSIYEHRPIKRMKVRAKDMPYMEPAWTKAINARHRFSKRISQNRTPENFELKRQ